MKYLFHVGVPALIQFATMAFVILATQGDGSFIGLGAMLLGGWGIPATAVINFAMARTNPRAWRSFWISLPVPALLLLMLLADAMLDL